MLKTVHGSPDLIVVQGDTSSAMGAALAAVTAGLPIAHVEAGLRTHDPSQPWPEEEYRRRIDAESDILFAPTEAAADNLRAENVRGAIHVTGNTGIDALLHVERNLPPVRLRESGKFRLLVTCHRRENWGVNLRAVATALVELARDRTIDIVVVLHPNPNVAETLRRCLDKQDAISLQPPCAHGELVAMMRDSDLILSDSGGMQEEAPALGTPLLVLRDKTERPEGIASGNMRLVGCTSAAITSAVRELRADPVTLAAMSRRAYPYGDGLSAPRIAGLIAQWAEGRASSGRRAI